MHSFEHEAFPEDDEVVISDLDTSDERKKYAPVYRKLKYLHAISQPPRIGIIVFVLILLIGGSVFAYLYIPAHHSKVDVVTYGGSLQMVNNSLNPATNFSVANGIVYIATEDGKISAQRASDGKILWRSKEAGTLSQQPVVTDTFVFLILQNNRGDQIYALRTSDGKLQWSFQTPLLASQTLLSKDGVVYLLTQIGTIEALSEKAGRQLWQFATGETAPIAVDDVLYPSAEVVAIRVNQTVYFMRTQNGSRLWYYTSNLPETPTSWRPDIEGDVVYIHTNTNVLQARSLMDGHLRWQYPNISWSSTLQNGIVYMYTWNDTIKAVHGRDGSLLWQYNEPDINSWNAYQQGLLFITLSDGSIEALRASDGILRWQVKPSKNSTISWPSTANDGFLYIITNASGTAIFALRTPDGSVAWHHSLSNSESQFMPVVTDNAVYTWQSDGSINAWSSRNGQLLWHYHPAIQIAQGPTEVNGLVYIRQGDGTIIVLRAKDGKIVWGDTGSVGP